MVKRKAMFLAPLAIAAMALPGIWAASASASGTAHGGLVHLYQVDTTTGPQGGTQPQLDSDSVTLTGAVADYGVDSEAPPGSNINTFSFPADNPPSSFQIDITNFGTVVSQTVYPNCSYTQVVTGHDLQIVPGTSTGIYAGISGHFDVIATFAGKVNSLPNGCDVSQIGNTPAGLDFVEGTGVVHIPG
jgi:hypothetical protein